MSCAASSRLVVEDYDVGSGDPGGDHVVVGGPVVLLTESSLYTNAETEKNVSVALAMSSICSKEATTFGVGDSSTATIAELSKRGRYVIANNSVVGSGYSSDRVTFSVPTQKKR